MQTKKQTFFASYSDALLNYLKNNGIKQSFLVKKTGKGKDQISNYVNGEVEPNPKSKQMLDEALGINIEEVMPNKWIIRSNHPHLDNARDSVDQVEHLVSDYKVSGPREDDPQKLLELAEMLIRTAKELLKK